MGEPTEQGIVAALIRRQLRQEYATQVAELQARIERLRNQVAELQAENERLRNKCEGYGCAIDSVFSPRSTRSWRKINE